MKRLSLVKEFIDAIPDHGTWVLLAKYRLILPESSYFMD
jgi:hypothetical protein